MKLLKKTLSVGLSLVMCAAMVSPAFAASFKDLQDAIDGTGGTQIGDTGRYGYAETTHEDGSKSYGIEAWQSDRTVNGEADGQTRYVKLNEDVEYDAGKDADNKTITISADTDVTLDLNGKDIDAKEETGSSVITVNENGALTLNDSSGNDSGKITGGKNSTGGGVKNDGMFTMNGGAISGNAATGAGVVVSGGGVKNTGTFTMNGGAISENRAPIRSGGVGNAGTFTMNGGVISGNRSGACSGVYTQGTFTMNGGAITDNRCTGTNFAAVYAPPGAGTFTMNGGVIWKNDAAKDIDGAVTVNESIADQLNCEHDFVEEAGTHTCTKCGASYSDTYGKWAVADPTCAAGGSISYSNGARSMSYTTPDPKPAHTPGDPVEENRVEAQVGVAGSYDEVVYCTECDEELSRETKTLDALTEDDSGNQDNQGTPGNNNPGNNDNQPSGGSGGGENNAPVTPAETEVIDEPDVPLAELPEEPAQEPADETEVIEDADVPLAELPEESAQEPAAESAAELEVIEDGAVPLSDVPQTGEASTALWLAAVLIAGMGLVYVNTGKRRQNAR